MTYTIPSADTALFATLPLEVQKEVHLRLKALARIATAKSARAGAAEVAREMTGMPGFSDKRLVANHTDYAASGGDWRVLVNKAKAGAAWWHRANPGATVAENTVFLQWVKAQFERDQRGSRNAWRGIIRRWRDWAGTGDARWSIPGYATPPAADTRTGEIPAGWSYDNLMRLAQPDDVDRVSARVGTNAAAQYRMPVLTTRAGLLLGEFVQFDDHEFNLKIQYPGQPRPFRPKGFFALDLLSAAYAGKSFKPTLWDAEAEAKRTLTEKDFAWFVVHVLMDFGYRPCERGTTLIVEHGTAAIREAFEQRIVAVTGGQVRVRRSGILGDAQMASLFEGRGRGNFHFKAAIESSFSLVDNAFANLPAQVGKDRLHAPEQIHGLEAETNRLLKAMESLPPERANRLILPLLTWDQFRDQALDIFHRIEMRVDHELEGWEKCGFVEKEWRMAPELPWLPVAAIARMTEAQRQMTMALLESDHRLMRVRKLSPLEVHKRHKGDLTRVRAEQMPALVGLDRLEELGREVRVDKGLITISGRDLGGEFHFIAQRDARNRLPNGEKYVGLVNPHAPDQLVACDAKGRVIGVCPLWHRPARNDADGVLRQMGAQRAWDANRQADQDIRHLPYAQQHAAERAHNDALLDTAKPVLPQEVATDRKAKADASAADKALDALFE